MGEEREEGKDEEKSSLVMVMHSPEEKTKRKISHHNKIAKWEANGRVSDSAVQQSLRLSRDLGPVTTLTMTEGSSSPRSFNIVLYVPTQ